MAINLASKYSEKIETIYKRESFAKGRLNNRVSFVGVRSVNIYTPVTVPLVDYTRSGANRYGVPTEMQDTKQEMTMTQDKAFSLTIDRGNNIDQLNIKAAGRMLALQVKEQAAPLYDQYVFGVLGAGAGTKITNTAPAAATIVKRITDGTVVLDEEEVPEGDRTLFINPKMFAILRLSPEFLGLEKLGTRSLAKGQVGEFDGMTVVKVPTVRLPAKMNFLIVHKEAATAPIKLNEARIHTDPPGLSGSLLEGRQYYDCFIFDVKKKGIYADFTT